MAEVIRQHLDFQTGKVHKSPLLFKSFYQLTAGREEKIILTLGEYPYVIPTHGDPFSMGHSYGMITPEEFAFQAQDALDPEQWKKFCAGENISYQHFYPKRGVYLVEGTILPLSLSFTFLSAVLITP